MSTAVFLHLKTSSHNIMSQPAHTFVVFQEALEAFYLCLDLQDIPAGVFVNDGLVSDHLGPLGKVECGQTLSKTSKCTHTHNQNQHWGHGL